MMKARVNDRAITVREVSLPTGVMIPVGTHGFVIEAVQAPERYEVQFDLDADQALATVSPDDFGLA